MNKYLADIVSFSTDARHAWRGDGVPGIWQELAERTVFRIARSAEYDLYERDLATVNRVAPPTGVDIRVLAPEEHSAIGALMTSRRRARLDGDPARRTMVAALRGHDIVGYSWWSEALDATLDFSPLTLPHDASFHRFVHVDRAERHRGLAAALFSAGERYLFEQGTRVCWFILASGNVAGALAALNRCGSSSRHLARLSYRKLPFRTTRTLTVTEPS
jgi:ribosomal protein S18 acetylase RimI-like enzyme